MLNGNQALAIELLKQACEDISKHAKEIIGEMNCPINLDITIHMSNQEEGYPTITINRENLVSFTKELDDLIMENL